MKYNDTLVFSTEVANILLARGHRILKIRPNLTEPNRLVFIFKGQLQEEVNGILVDLGLREG